MTALPLVASVFSDSRAVSLSANRSVKLIILSCRVEGGEQREFGLLLDEAIELTNRLVDLTTKAFHSFRLPDTPPEDPTVGEEFGRSRVTLTGVTSVEFSDDFSSIEVLLNQGSEVPELRLVFEMNNAADMCASLITDLLSLGKKWVSLD